MTDDAREVTSRARRVRTLAVVGVFLLIAAAYIGSIAGVWMLHSDSACYLGLGRSLARGEGYTFNHAPFGKYPPVFPFMLSLVFRTVGEDVRGFQVVTALCGIVALLGAFALVRPRAGVGAALGVAVLAASSTWFWSYSSVYTLSTIPYTMFAMVSLWLAERQIRSARFAPVPWLVVTVCLLLAIFTRLVGAALVMAVAGGLVFAKGQRWPARQRWAVAAAVSVLCAAALGWWVQRGWRAGMGSSYKNLMTHEPMDMLENPFPKLRLRAQAWAAAPLGIEPELVSWPVGAALVAVFILPGVVSGFRRTRSAAEFFVATHFLVTFIHGGMGGKERYVIPVVPLIFYFAYQTLKLYGAGIRRLVGPRRVAAMAPGGWLAWLQRAGMTLAFLAVLLPALYQRKRARGGAHAFAAGWRRKKAKSFRHWRSFARLIDEEGPPDATIYPGPGGTWAIVHYVSGHRVAKLHYRWRGMRILESMVEWEADFVLAHKHHTTYEGLIAAMNEHPECFTVVNDEGLLRLYRIHKARLRAVVAAAAADPSQALPFAEEHP